LEEIPRYELPDPESPLTGTLPIPTLDPAADTGLAEVEWFAEPDVGIGRQFGTESLVGDLRWADEITAEEDLDDDPPGDGA
jgi:hypothetical protein